jgi:hypothetical protein
MEFNHRSKQYHEIQVRMTTTPRHDMTSRSRLPHFCWCRLNSKKRSEERRRLGSDIIVIIPYRLQETRVIISSYQLTNIKYQTVNNSHTNCKVNEGNLVKGGDALGIKSLREKHWLFHEDHRHPDSIDSRTNYHHSSVYTHNTNQSLTRNQIVSWK